MAGLWFPYPFSHFSATGRPKYVVCSEVGLESCSTKTSFQLGIQSVHSNRGVFSFKMFYLSSVTFPLGEPLWYMTVFSCQPSLQAESCDCFRCWGWVNFPSVCAIMVVWSRYRVPLQNFGTSNAVATSEILLTLWGHYLSHSLQLWELKQTIEGETYYLGFQKNMRINVIKGSQRWLFLHA